MSAPLLGNNWVNTEKKFLVLLIKYYHYECMNAIYMRIFT